MRLSMLLFQSQSISLSVSWDREVRQKKETLWVFLVCSLQGTGSFLFGKQPDVAGNHTFLFLLQVPCSPKCAWEP